MFTLKGHGTGLCTTDEEINLRSRDFSGFTSVPGTGNFGPVSGGLRTLDLRLGSLHFGSPDPTSRNISVVKEAEAYQGEEVGVAILKAGPIRLGVGAGHCEDMPRSRGLVRVGRDPHRVAEKVPGAQISGAWASIMAELRVTTSTG